MNYTAGHKVRITYSGHTINGEVALASPNGRSLLLRFESMLVAPDAEGAYAYGMPVLSDDDGVYRDLMLGQPVLIAEATS